jgi:hypothetical protein
LPAFTPWAFPQLAGVGVGLHAGHAWFGSNAVPFLMQ